MTNRSTECLFAKLSYHFDQVCNKILHKFVAKQKVSLCSDIANVIWHVMRSPPIVIYHEHVDLSIHRTHCLIRSAFQPTFKGILFNATESYFKQEGCTKHVKEGKSDFIIQGTFYKSNSIEPWGKRLREALKCRSL